MPLKSDRFLSLAEVAEMIGVSVGSIRNGDAGTDDLPKIKMGGRVLYSLHDVEAFMAGKRREAEQKQAAAAISKARRFEEKSRRRHNTQKRLSAIIQSLKNKSS